MIMMILKKILLRCQPVCSAGMEAIGLEVLLPVEERKVVAGKIKVLPEDFCVKEINPRGRGHHFFGKKTWRSLY